MTVTIKKLIKSDTSKDTFIVSAGTIINGVAGGLFFILAPRFLGPSDYGIFSTVIAVGILINSISNFGIDTGVLKFAVKDSGQFPKILSMALKSYLLLGVITAFIGIFISGIIAQYLNHPEIVNLLRIAFIGNFFLLLSNFYIAALQAKKEFLKSSLVAIVSNITRLALLLFAFYFFQLGLTVLTIIFFASILVSVIGGSIILPVKFEPIHKDSLKKFYKYNLWIALSLIVSSIPFENVLLLKLSGPVQTGLYAAPFKILTFVHQIGGNFSRVLASRFSSFDSKEKVISYSRKSASIITAFIIGLIILVVFAKPLVSIILGSQFIDSIILMQILSIGFIFFLASIIPSAIILYYLGKSVILFQITLGKYLFLLFLLIYLVPEYKAIGAAYAFVIAEITAFLLMTFYSFIKLKSHQSD